MNKQKDHAFRKDIYLLGIDEEGIRYWLEQATWDCDWYWGFGYVETYTSNKEPSIARDISSHQHIDSSFLGDKNDKKDEFCHNIFDSKLLKETTFTEQEGWELSELFQQYYLLRKTAEYYKYGEANIAGTTIPNDLRLDIYDDINKKRMPVIFNRIYEILTPKK